MLLSDFISSPFLLYLGITLAIIGAISMFFIHRLNDQNHKIVSMLGLVSTMAEELSVVRSKLYLSNPIPNSNPNSSAFTHSGGNQYTTVNKLQDNTSLIDVSDNDESSDSDSSDSSDSSSESSSDSDSSSDSSDSESIFEDNTSNSDKESGDCSMNDSSLGDSSNGNMSVGDIKLINITSQDTINPFTPFCISNAEKSIDMVLVDETDDSNNEDVVLDEQMELGTENIANILNYVKLVKVTEDETLDGYNVLSPNDYKKMPIQKLKSIAVERGLTTTMEVSKLKKNDLVKLLETSNTASPQIPLKTQISCLSLDDIDGNLANEIH